MNKIIFLFFSYPKYIKNKYAIINCKAFLDFKKKLVKYNIINELSEKYTKVILEPEVFILKQQNHYRFEKWLNIKDFLNNLPANCYFSLDYPSDMNINYQYQFITKTHYNIKKYHYSKHYINTVQFLFFNFESFKENFDIINNIESKSKIMGIGNLCRLFSNSRKTKTFYLKLFNYIKDNINKNNYKWLHIYGLGLAYIKPFYSILKNSFKVLSVDSTKWTRACNSNLKLQFGLNCNRNNKQLFFNEYMKTIQKRNIPIEY